MVNNILSLFSNIFSSKPDSVGDVSNVPHALAPSEGKGTYDNPYHIDRIENLYWIAKKPAKWNKHYVQTADIDATETRNWHDGNGFSNIGYFKSKKDHKPFSGTYDGQNYVIRGLSIARDYSGYTGMFGYTYGAKIRNVILDDVSIIGKSYVGSLIGYCRMTIVERCSSSGKVSGTNRVGGLIGANYWFSSMVNCYSMTDVNGANYVGGLVGAMLNSSILYCYSKSKMKSNHPLCVGGLVGYTWGASKTENSFWDTEFSCCQKSASGIGKTTEEMKDIATFQNSGWDFENTWSIDQEVQEGYPFFNVCQRTI